MRLDVPVTTGVDDGQTGECVSQSLELELQLRPVDVLVVVDTSKLHAAARVQGDPGAQLDVRFGCDVGFEPAG